MKSILKLVASLGLVCFIGGGSLYLVNNLTREPIAVAEQNALLSSLSLVLPAETASTRAIDGTAFFKALDADGNVIAYAGHGVGKGGFKGDVKLLVGLSPEGRILGVMVTEHSETPGIGGKATDRKLEKSLWNVLAGKVEDNAFPPNAYLDSFVGRQAVEFVFGGNGDNGVQGVSGATYSSRAVVNGINEISAAFEKLPRQH